MDPDPDPSVLHEPSLIKTGARSTRFPTLQLHMLQAEGLKSPSERNEEI
jgi:hypothetical protein